MDDQRILRVGDTVVMPVEVYDDLLARLLAAEARNADDQRSWWQPFEGAK